MELTVQIPDALATRMSASGGDLSRRAIEALALEEFKSGRITKPELRRLLGFGTRYWLDGFLKSHDVYEDYTMADLERDRDALKQIGILTGAARHRRYQPDQLLGTDRKHRSPSSPI
jgi:hypothetical protein